MNHMGNEFFFEGHQGDTDWAQQIADQLETVKAAAPRLLFGSIRTTVSANTGSQLSGRRPSTLTLPTLAGPDSCFKFLGPDSRPQDRRHVSQ